MFNVLVNPNVFLLSLLPQGFNLKVVQVGADGVRRVDWHDYEAIRRDAARIGTLPLCFICSGPTEIHSSIFFFLLRLLIPSK